MGIIPADRTAEATVVRAPELRLGPGGADVGLPAGGRIVGLGLLRDHPGSRAELLALAGVRA